MKSDAIRFRAGRLLRIRYSTNSTGSCSSFVRVSRVSLGSACGPASSTWNLSRLNHCETNSCEARKARVGDHPVDFGIQLLAQHPLAASCSVLRVRRAVPQEVGELGGQFVIIQGLGRGRRAVSIRNRNCGEVSTTCRASLMASWKLRPLAGISGTRPWSDCSSAAVMGRR